MNKLFLQTFGCQMNERDSEAVTGLMMDKGYSMTDDPATASVILYNTCSIRDHAEQKLFGRMGYFKKMKISNPDLVIGIMGCMAQQYADEFFKMNSEIDLVCGPGNLHQIPALVDDIRLSRAPRLAVDKLGDEYGLEGVHYRSEKNKGLVTIMTGCDHKCTYCIVPFTRGAERSRPSDNIIEELRDLQSRGFVEVMLLGQNVNSFGKGSQESIDFVGLLEKIQKETPGISRVRFMTSHPKDAHPRLFRAIADLPGVCEHLHLPVQSGSSQVLKRMKREHTREWYLDRIAEFRQIVPHATLTTDIIVGFPGETRKDFEDTLSLMSQVGFDAAFMFKYSARPGTPALKLQDDISEQEKDERLQELMALQKSISIKKNMALIGSTQEVLFESPTKKDVNRYQGKSRTFKKVVVSSDKDLIGKVQRVKISAIADETLTGDLI